MPARNRKFNIVGVINRLSRHTSMLNLSRRIPTDRLERVAKNVIPHVRSQLLPVVSSLSKMYPRKNSGVLDFLERC
jgi:hypothetical protein